MWYMIITTQFPKPLEILFTELDDISKPGNVIEQFIRTLRWLRKNRSQLGAGPLH